MALRPLKDLADLLPVIHVLVFHLLHRCPGDDQPVKIASLNIRKTLVEFIQMTHGSIFCLMALYCHKSDIYLQRCVGKGTQKLKLCLLFQRHQVQNEDLNGADILMGFPGETEAHVLETLEVVRSLPLTYAHVFPYSARPGTVAAELPDQVGKAVRNAPPAYARWWRPSAKPSGRTPLHVSGCSWRWTAMRMPEPPPASTAWMSAMYPAVCGRRCGGKATR